MKIKDTQLTGVTEENSQERKELRPYQFDYVYSKEKFPALASSWGTGKTMCLIIRSLLYAEEIPNNLIYILRREWVDLKDSTIKDFESYTGLKVDSNRNVKFKNGSVIMFRHIEELNRAGKNLQNVNLGAFFIEQGEELPTDREFFILYGRLRRKVNPSEYFKSLNLPYHTGSIIANVAGDNWIKKIWKDPEDAGRTKKDFPLIEAVTHDNAINLPDDFMETLELLRQRKPEIYNRYVMNDWSAEVEGKVFKRIDDCMAGGFEEAQQGFDYIMGGDFAKTVDFNAAVVICRQTKHVVYGEAWNRTSWNLTKEKFKAIAYRYNNAVLIPDSTGVGDPIVEDLVRDGVRVYHSHKGKSDISVPGIKFTNVNKEQIIEKLQVSIEQVLVTFPAKLEEMIQQLRDFECQALPSGNYRYTAPLGKHDDWVIAFALAVWGLYIYAPDYTEKGEETSADNFWSRVNRDAKIFDSVNGGSNGREIMAEEGCRII